MIRALPARRWSSSARQCALRAREAQFPKTCKTVLAALAKEQQPYVAMLGCNDSRVPPELLFDAGFGELFVVRLAGNVVSAEVAGTLQCAASHPRTPLFLRGEKSTALLTSPLCDRSEKEHSVGTCRQSGEAKWLHLGGPAQVQGRNAGLPSESSGGDAPPAHGWGADG